MAVVAGSQLVQFALMGVVFWWYRPRSWVPQTVAERQLGAVVVGYVISCFLITGVSAILLGAEKLYPREDYPHFAVAAGLVYFILGSSYWGRCYAFAVALASIGRHLHQLGKKF